MPELNIPFPGIWECYLRCEYLRGLKDMHGLAVPCSVGSLVSLPGRPLQFNVRLPTGALIDRMPISALVSRAGVEPMPNGKFPARMPPGERGHRPSDLDTYRVIATTLFDHEHQPLSCFSTEAVAVEREDLALRPMDVRLDGEWVRGRYMFTVDWPIDHYGHSGHKCAHVVELPDGAYVAYPNNMVCSLDAATVSQPFSETGRIPDIRIRDWNVTCEDGWRTEDSDAQMYEARPESKRSSLASEMRRMSSQSAGVCVSDVNEAIGEVVANSAEKGSPLTGPAWVPSRDAQRAVAEGNAARSKEAKPGWEWLRPWWLRPNTTSEDVRRFVESVAEIPRRDANGHFPGCYGGSGCEATRCNSSLPKLPLTAQETIDKLAADVDATVRELAKIEVVHPKSLEALPNTSSEDVHRFVAFVARAAGGETAHVHRWSSPTGNSAARELYCRECRATKPNPEAQNLSDLAAKLKAIDAKLRKSPVDATRFAAGMSKAGATHAIAIMEAYERGRADSCGAEAERKLPDMQELQRPISVHGFRVAVLVNDGSCSVVERDVMAPNAIAAIQAACAQVHGKTGISTGFRDVRRLVVMPSGEVVAGEPIDVPSHDRDEDDTPPNGIERRCGTCASWAGYPHGEWGVCADKPSHSSMPTAMPGWCPGWRAKERSRCSQANCFVHDGEACARGHMRPSDCPGRSAKEKP